MMQQPSVLMPGFIMVAGILAVVLVVALVAALFSGRVWAVVAGVFGTLLLIVGGLLLVGTMIFVSRHSTREVARMAIPDGGSVEIVDEARPLVAASAAEAQPKPSTDPNAANTGGTTASTDTPSGPPRPAWMDGPLGRTENVYRTTVKVGPLFSRMECEQQLPEALRLAVKTYADHLLGEGKGQYVDLEQAFIRNHLVRGEWEERRETTFDTMITLHELLEFDRDANDAIEANYKQSVVMGRLGYTAAGGGVVLGLLTILFGYLKLDTLTRGYYTGRLSLTALAAILGLAAIAGLLVLA
jgi:hypothetical protein